MFIKYDILAMPRVTFFIACFLTVTAAFAGAVPPLGLESRGDDLDPGLFTLPENDLDATTNVNGGSSDLDLSLSLLALNPDDSNVPLFDDSGSPSLLPAGDMIISNNLASSCLGPASKRRRDLFNEDVMLLCTVPHPS